MKITFTYHGKLTELTGKKEEQINLNSQSSQAIRTVLIERYPALQMVSFQLAQSNKILQISDSIEESGIDVFPPFSGG